VTLAKFGLTDKSDGNDGCGDHRGMFGVGNMHQNQSLNPGTALSTAQMNARFNRFSLGVNAIKSMRTATLASQTRSLPRPQP
jgi:hypothetical protein